jgi:branched-chain amino acid transport system substrate-binding protein
MRVGRQHMGPSAASGRFLIVALSVVLSATACGSATSSQTKTPIKIGAEGPMTGTFASTGQALWEGAQVAAKEINDAGGILGRPLHLDQIDDVNDPADAVPALRKAISVDGIQFLDGPSSTVRPATEPILDQYKIPFMFQGGTGSFDHNTDTYAWRPSPSDAQLGVAMAAYAIKKGYKTAAMMFNTGPSQSLEQVVAGAYTKNGGTVVANAVLALAVSSYGTEVQTVVKSHPDVIFAQYDDTTAPALFHALEQQDNLAIPIIGSDESAGAAQIKLITPAAAHKALVSVEASTNAGPAIDTYKHYYDLVYPGQVVNTDANFSYDAILELALAIDAAGSTDPAKVIAAIPQVCNPPGTDVTNYADGLAALHAGKKIHFVGAGGPSGYDQYHNSTGTFSVYQADASTGVEAPIASLTVSDMAAAAQGSLTFGAAG